MNPPMLETFADPFQLFRVVVGLLALWEIVTLVRDWRQAYVDRYQFLQRVAGRYHVHDLLRSTVRFQLWSIVLRRRGWEEIRILLVQAAAVGCAVLSWLIQ